MGVETKTNLVQWVISVLLAIIGWLLVTTWGSTSKQLSSIQADIIELQIQMTQFQSTQMTEARVKEICEMEFLKRFKQ